MFVDCTTGEKRPYTPEEEAVNEAERLARAQRATDGMIASGYAKLNISIGPPLIVTVASMEGVGFSGLSRIAKGRIRLYFEQPQLDDNYSVQVTIRNSTAVGHTVSNQTTLYVEVMIWTIAAVPAAVDIPGIFVDVKRITRS